MSVLRELPIGVFLERLASSAPTPGGGAAAALAGALAAALGEMVCRLTVGKPRFAAVEPRVLELTARFERARRLLESLMEEDAAAYQELSAAFKRDKGDPQRGELIAQAAAIAATVPLESAILAQRLESDLNELAGIGNPNLAADVTAALALARAGREGAVANVRANLPFLREENRLPIERELSGLSEPRRTDL